MKPLASSSKICMAGLALSFLLAGCGFQLRGAPPVSAALQPLAVDCSGGVPEQLCGSVKEQLKLGDIDLQAAEHAEYVLKISNFRRERRASAITASAAAAEYTLRQTVDVEVLTSGNIPLIAPANLNSSETYSYDESNVLAKQREEEALQEQLYDRLAQQIIFRLAPLDQARIDRLKEEAEQAGSQDNGQP